MDLRRTLTPRHHIFTTSGSCSVRPLVDTVTGVGELYAPPVAACGLRLLTRIVVDGRELNDDGNFGKGDVGILCADGVWHLDGIECRGTYHWWSGGRLVSLALASRLTPLADGAGYVLRLSLRNRGDRIRKLSWLPVLTAGAPALRPLEAWDFRSADEGAPAVQTGPCQWENGDVSVRVIPHLGTHALDPGGTLTLWLGLEISPAGQSGRIRSTEDLPAAEKAARSRWRRVLRRTAENFPVLHSDVPGLEDYYRRSLVSGLVCLWDNPDYVARPWVATGGLDGGAVCAYPWDIAGYASGAMTLLLGRQVAHQLELFADYGLDRHSRMSLLGTGREVRYAYSLWAFISLLDAAARLRGAPNRRLLEKAAALLEASEDSHPGHGGFLDYGNQHNLLEMRASGWENVTVGPNAERAWCHDALAGLLPSGDRRIRKWRRKAVAIRRAIRKHLWDACSGWFKCLFPEGHSEKVYSIQAFDALRFGACTPAMAASVTSHVRDGAFLGEYGVSSVSAEDEAHYECNDPDWSGGGAYSGDGPVLALTLWESKRPRLAWEVLRRFFWTGRHLLYLPQELYCDRPAVVSHKRANIVAGLSGAEAVLFGLAGIRPHPDGLLEAAPAFPVKGDVAIEGLSCHGRKIDLHFNARSHKLRIDGRVSQGSRHHLCAE